MLREATFKDLCTQRRFKPSRAHWQSGAVGTRKDHTEMRHTCWLAGVVPFAEQHRSRLQVSSSFRVEVLTVKSGRRAVSGAVDTANYLNIVDRPMLRASVHLQMAMCHGPFALGRPISNSGRHGSILKREHSMHETYAVSKGYHLVLAS